MIEFLQNIWDSFENAYINEYYMRILGYTIKPQKFPPEESLLFLIVINFLFHVRSNQYKIYEVFIYIYGVMGITRIHKIKQSLEFTILINLIFICIHLSGVKLDRREQAMLVLILCWEYKRIIYKSVIGLFRSVFKKKKISFSDVFISIQYVTINKFIIHYCGFWWMRNLPLLIRIVQNYRIFTFRSIMGIIRFAILMVLPLITHLPMWFYLKAFVTVWLIFNDSIFVFKIRRLFTKHIYFYPEYSYVMMLGFDVFCRVSWIWIPIEVTYWNVLRKIVENYFRIESREAADQEEHETKDICL